MSDNGQEKQVLFEIKQLCKSFGPTKVLDHIDATIRQGEVVVIVGPSGSGKSTFLRSLNLLEMPTSGEILFEGKEITDPKSNLNQYRQKIGMVFQHFNLFANKTILENMTLAPIKVLKKSKAEAEKEAMELLARVGLAEKANAYPAQLSGGMRQRAGIARTLAMNPKVILMDEPFSALDPMTRAELQDEVHRLQLRFHKTIVFVTHDMDEAVKLADRICILQNGHVVQCDKPENILKHPANEYINSFIGKNRLWENPSFIRAEDIMCPRPITISQSRTVVQAVQLMRHYNIDSLLVTGDDNKFAGMVWLQDLIGIDQYSSPISSFLSDDYLSVRADDSLSTVLEKVADYGEKDFGILPVLDAEGAIRGFLNRSSLLSTLSRRFIDEPVERDEQEGA